MHLGGWLQQSEFLYIKTSKRIVLLVLEEFLNINVAVMNHRSSSCSHTFEEDELFLIISNMKCVEKSCINLLNINFHFCVWLGKTNFILKTVLFHLTQVKSLIFNNQCYAKTRVYNSKVIINYLALYNDLKAKSR